MGDIDNEPFGENGRPDEGDTDETFPLIPTRDRTRVQIHTPGEEETSFGGLSQNTRVLQEIVEGLYDRLSERFQPKPEVLYTDLFEIRDGELYYKDDNRPLTNNGRLRATGTISDILGKRRLRNLGFDIPKGKITARQAAKLNKIQEGFPSTSKIETATVEELETISGDVINSTEDIISLLKQQSVDHEATQTDDLFKYPVREMLSLDKSVQKVRGGLQLATAKMVSTEHKIDYEEKKLKEMEDPDRSATYTDEQREIVKKRLEKLNDKLKFHHEKIDNIKGKLNTQIKSIRETIAKILDKETTLGEKIRTLFREQGVTVVSVLTAFGMVIGLLVETLTPGGGGSSTGNAQNHEKGGTTEGGAREWIKNKLNALGSLLGRLAGMAAAALPGIIGSIVSWILNRAKEAVGWLSQNLWALIVGIGGLIYTYLVTKR